MTPPDRVVFFVQGQRVPAARVRGFLIADALARAGVAVELRVPHPSVYGDTRLGYPWSMLTRFMLRPVSAMVQVTHLRGLRASDIVFIQRPLV